MNLADRAALFTVLALIAIGPDAANWYIMFSWVFAIAYGVYALCTSIDGGIK